MVVVYGDVGGVWDYGGNARKRWLVVVVTVGLVDKPLNEESSIVNSKLVVLIR